MTYFWIASFSIIGLIGIKKDSSKKMSMLILSIMFIMIALCKNMSPGSDYVNYVRQYESIQSGVFYGSFESLYNAIIQFFSSFIESYDVFKVLITVCQMVLLILSIRKLTLASSMVLALYMIYPAVIEGELTRFVMGAMLVVYALASFMCSIIERKNVRVKAIEYIIITSIAGLIHTSLFVFLIFIAIPIFMPGSYLLSKPGAKKTLVIMAITFCAGLICFFALGEIFVRVALKSGHFSVYENALSFRIKMESIHILMYHGAIYSARVIFSYYLLTKAQKNIAFNEVDTELSIDSKEYCRRYLSVLFAVNLISAFFLIPDMISIVFDRLYYVIDLFNYVGAATLCLQFPKKSISRVKVKIAAISYTMFYLLMFLRQGEYYVTLFKQFFEYNSLLGFISSSILY